MKAKVILSIIIVGLFSGCSQLPPLNFTPRDVSRVRSRVNAELRSVIVTVAQQNEKKGDIDFNLAYSQTIPDLWKVALEDALNRSLAFSDSSIRKLSLRVSILKFDVPAGGASMTTKTLARYDIQDRSSGDVVYSVEIAADGEVSATYAFAGMVRATESANRAVQNNILEFIRQLDSNGTKKIENKK